MRRQSRELAMQVLFQSEFTPQIPMQSFLQVFEETIEPETVQFAQELIHGVQTHKDSIDAKIQVFSRNWKVERMATIDRNILRIAVYEMFFAPSLIKPAIAINEAVEVAKRFSTTESSSFINGLLDQISKEK